MKITSSSLLATLGLTSIVCGSYTDVQGKVSLDYTLNGASCGAVQHTPGKKSQISFYIEKAIGNEKSNLEDLKIPFVVFKYTEIAKYENIPILDTFVKGYGSESRSDLYSGLVDFKSNKFIINSDKKDEETQSSVIYTDYLKYDTEIVTSSFNVNESGIYCIYIAPPLDKDIKEFSIPVKYESSTGYLTPTDYRLYSTIKIFSFLGLFLFAYLFYYILRFKTDKNFTNMDNISYISKGVIFYVLFPIVCLQLVQIVIDGLRNNFSSSDQPSLILNFLIFSLLWVITCFSIFVQYIILLFSMGFGVIYYVKESSRNYRKLPDSYLKRANQLLFINIGIATLEFLVTLFSTKSSNPYFDPILRGMLFQETSQLSNSSMDFARGILSFVGGIFSFVWFIYSIYHYFATKKVIATFPVMEDTGVLERITKSFRYSVLIIFVLPFFVTIGAGALFIFQTVSKSIDWNNLPIDSSISSDLRLQSVLQFQFTEKFIFDNLSFQSSFLSTYIIIICIYFIWIKDNNGLIVDKEHYTSVPSFADDDDI